jgi:TonB family protein
MAAAKKKKVDGKSIAVIVVTCILFVAVVGFFLNILLSDSSGPRQKTKIASVTLVKPPPPEQKPPEQKLEQEVQKQDNVQQIETAQPDQAQQNDADAPPPGADLGLDAEGGAGSDGFGLVGKKGGRALVLGGPGGGGGGMNRLSLMSKYGWYTTKIQDEVKRHVRKKLDAEGGIPKGKLQVTVKIVLDQKGAIVKYQIIASSGDSRMDEALKASLPGFRISQPPPEGMPQGMTIRITSQG